MIPTELQSRSFRPYITTTSSSTPSPSASFKTPSPYSPDSTPSHNHNHHQLSSPFSTSLSSRSRFSPSTFSYNARIAIALVPAATFLLDLGGTPVVATVTLCLLLAYILDSLNFKSGAFFGVWLSLISGQIAFFLSSGLISAFNSVPLGLLAMLLCSQTNFLIVSWASLQFKWIQLESPSIVLALEKLLFACVPSTASSLLAWATVSAFGMHNAAYYLMAFNCVFYWIFAIPRVSSFKSISEVKYYGGEVPSEIFILGPLESCILTLNMLFFPLVFHVASHFRVLFIYTASICDLFLLFFIPFLFLLYASTRGALWWVTKNPAQLQSIRVVNGAIALVCIVVCLEVRVVFHAFGKYIQVLPPINYLLVTVTMLGGAGAAGAYSLGMVSDAFGSVAFTALAVLVSAAGAIVVGFPILFLPLPAVAGFYLARFFTKKSLTSYFTFFMLGSLMVTWFVYHNFWDLNVWLGGMSLKSFCKLIVANVILAMAVPGLSLPSKLQFIAEIGLIGHALLLCDMENRIFNYSAIYYYGLDEDVMYPSYMVIITTFLGLALLRRLTADHRVGPKTVWILSCLYSAKLAMLFISSKSVVWATAVLLLAISPPLLLYKDKSRRSSKMKPWQAYGHAAVISLSIWFFRVTIFEALQWWCGKPPSDALLLGLYIVLTGLACIPIIVLHFHHILSAKRCLVLVVAAGLLFIVIQPPIPMSLAYQSDVINAAHESSDDISIYGFLASKPTWPSWLLIVAIMLTIASVTSIIPIKYIVELRAFYAISMGIAMGVYISAEYFLQAAALHVLIVVTMISTSVFMVFTHFPSASSTLLLPWIFALLVALFPVTYLLEGQMRIKSVLGNGGFGDLEDEEDSKLTNLLAVEGARTSLLGLYAAIFMLVALEIKFEIASLMREKYIERGGMKQNQSSQNNYVPRMRFIQQRRASTVPTFTIKRMATDGAWMPAVGNLATVLSFAICLILNVNLTGGSNQAIFFLAPILLLLNQDSDFFAGFGDKQRYFPVAVAISAYLVLAALYSIWEDIWQGNAGWGIEIGDPHWFFAVKNLALLVLTFPNHILFNQFVWSYIKHTDSTPLITLPLNLPSIIMTDVIKIRVLGILGIIYAIAQTIISRQQYISGMKYI